jgi:hypothetical protein
VSEGGHFVVKEMSDRVARTLLGADTAKSVGDPSRELKRARRRAFFESWKKKSPPVKYEPLAA